MVEERKKAEDEAQDPEVGDESPAPDTEVAAPEPEATTPDGRIEALEVEVERLREAHNKAVRAAAEYDNATKRAQRELQETRKFAITGLARDLLSTVDNLQRAVAAVPEDAIAENEQLRNLVTGVQMIEREVLGIFEGHNIQPVHPLGEPFDTHLHEAMFEIPDNDHPPGSVIQVVQTGYRLHDRLLRPARVGIAKGGPKGAEAPAGADGPGGQVDTKA